MSQEKKKPAEPMTIQKATNVVIKLAQVGIKHMNPMPPELKKEIQDAMELLKSTREYATAEAVAPVQMHQQMLEAGQLHMDHVRAADVAFTTRKGGAMTGHMNRAYRYLRYIKELGQFSTTDQAKQWVREQLKQGNLK